MNEAPTFLITEVRIGRKRTFGPGGAVSAIGKEPVEAPAMATALGLDGDEQADRRHHGGPDKAVHAYGRVHYAAWAAELPASADRFQPGGFGENLVIDGASEADICLGDRWRVDEALLEVSQGRQPCWKLNLRFGVEDMARRVQETGRTGWYFRVVEPGLMSAGTQAILESRPLPEWPLTRVSELLYRRTLDRPALSAFATLPGLPESWRRLAENRLKSGTVESWKRRLDGSG